MKAKAKGYSPPNRWWLIWRILFHPPEHFDWRPSLWRRIQLRLKASLAIALGFCKGGYPPLTKCGLEINHLDVWYSETWGPASWEYGGVVWNQIDVCCGWRNLHYHFHEDQSV